MKKFSKVLEEVENGKYYKVIVQVELLVPASNEGEASYIADSTISSIKNISEYSISQVEETSKEYMNENTINDLNK
jgi:hypothetical protein